MKKVLTITAFSFFFLLPQISSSAVTLIDEESKSFKVGGRIHFDYVDYDQFFSNDADDGSDTFFRRVRFNMAGHWEDWKYKAVYDFEADGGNGDTADVYIQYTGFGKQALVTLGKHKVPFGFEELTSSNDILAIERNSNAAFAPGRKQGISLSGSNELFTYQIGYFDNEGAENDINGVAGARLIYHPFTESGRTLHFGISYVNAENDDINESTVTSIGTTATHFSTGSRIGIRPVRSDNGDIRRLTPRLYHEGYDGFALEFALSYQSLFFQSEYLSLSYDGFDPGNGIETADDADAWFAQVGWVVTGESREYKASSGVFSRIKPKNKSGAWEIFFRHSNADFTVPNTFYKCADSNGDKAINYIDIAECGRNDGGDVTTSVLGLNWYAHKNMRVGVNYIDAEDGDENNDGNAIAVRFQLTW